MTEQKIMIAFRIRPMDLKRLDHYAKRYDLTRTEYLTRAGLQELPDDITPDERFEELERRIEAVEHYQQLGG